MKVTSINVIPPNVPPPSKGPQQNLNDIKVYKFCHKKFESIKYEKIKNLCIYA